MKKMAFPNQTTDKDIEQSLDYIRRFTDSTPAVAVILGSGLGGFAEILNEKIKINTAQIPHYPKSTVDGHPGFLVFGKLKKNSILAIQGRTHYYEGYSIQDVAYSVRLMSKLGVKTILVTNAAGGVNSHLNPGDLMIITDHINFLFRNPLIGPVWKDEVRWPDLYNVYDLDYIDLIERIGLKLGIALHKGVLFVTSGPSYETPAEINMISKLGGDAVSMSTVPEVMVAAANAIKVAGISCITNLGSGISEIPLTHKEVTTVTRLIKPKFEYLLGEVLNEIGNKYQ